MGFHMYMYMHVVENHIFFDLQHQGVSVMMLGVWMWSLLVIMDHGTSEPSACILL